ncbi:MAG TPA: hypothetical protein VGM77_11865 [Gemmatimonadales bacterium]|jgi:hypothetical protein
MALRVTGLPADSWVTQATAGAPAALRVRAGEFFEATNGDLIDRLAAAGGAALAAASDRAGGRAAALDLLAADGLITLALLATAQRAPAELGQVAERLRQQATVAP